MSKPRVPVRMGVVACLLVVLAGCVEPSDRDVIPVVVISTDPATALTTIGWSGRQASCPAAASTFSVGLSIPADSIVVACD